MEANGSSKDVLFTDHCTQLIKQNNCIILLNQPAVNSDYSKTKILTAAADGVSRFTSVRCLSPWKWHLSYGYTGTCLCNIHIY